VVVALKSRTIPAADAVAQSIAALHCLRAAGARQIYFKYCSTFDSTPAGNIGPVIEALMAALGCELTIACPAFPENGRTVFKGHLFVGDALLSDSGMRDHPLTPMRDSNLIRVLQAQTTLRVGHLAYDVVARGEEAIRARIAALKATGVRIAIVDAIGDEDLRRLGPALSDMPLVTGGSGVAIGLPPNFNLRHAAEAAALPQRPGYRAIVSGSCSLATNAQVLDFMRRGGAGYALDPLRIVADPHEIERARAWALPRLAQGPVMIYSTAEPARVAQIQRELGSVTAGAVTERALGTVARALVEAGVTQLVVAGGETSGAVVQALGATALRIGPQIDPGVPWTATEEAQPILLALKSGNFGTTDFFTKCFTLLDSHERSPTA